MLTFVTQLANPGRLEHNLLCNPAGRANATAIARWQPRRRQQVTARVDGDIPEILFCLTGAAAAGNVIGSKTELGRAFTPPVCIMLITAVLANAGVLPATPAAQQTVRSIQLLLVSVATPILLLQGNLFKSFREAGRLLFWFVICAMGTVAGGLLAALFCRGPLAKLGPDAAKLTAALIAKNIGGGINFVAVSVILGISPPVVAAATCADSLLCLGYFPVISSMADAWCQAGFTSKQTVTQTEQATPRSISIVLAVASGILVLARSVLGRVNSNILPLASVLAVSIATFASPVVAPLLPTADLLGKVLLDLYFATAGAGTKNFWVAWRSYGVLFTFCGIMYLGHLAVVWASGSLVRLRNANDRDARLVLLASNANIGGPATAGALAASKGWNQEVSPAYLVGQFGNAIATFIGLGVYSVLR